MDEQRRMSANLRKEFARNKVDRMKPGVVMHIWILWSFSNSLRFFFGQKNTSLSKMRSCVFFKR